MIHQVSISTELSVDTLSLIKLFEEPERLCGSPRVIDAHQAEVGAWECESWIHDQSKDTKRVGSLTFIPTSHRTPLNPVLWRQLRLLRNHDPQGHRSGVRRTLFASNSH